jgi:hypothetical protein
VQGAIANVVGIRTVTAGGGIFLLVVVGLVFRERVLALVDPVPADITAGPASSPTRLPRP